MDQNIPLAVAYYMNGLNFKSSAEKLAETIELNAQGIPVKLTAIPYYFLMSHAAELFLKAALIKRGFETKALMKFDYRHNLSALLSELISKGVSVSENTISTIGGLCEQHKEHALRYTVLFDNGKKTYWPPIKLISESLDELFLLTRISTQGV